MSENLAMLPSYFVYIFVHLRQKARLRHVIFVNFRIEPSLNPTRTARPDLQLCHRLRLRNTGEKYLNVACLALVKNVPKIYVARLSISTSTQSKESIASKIKKALLVLKVADEGEKLETTLASSVYLRSGFKSA